MRIDSRLLLTSILLSMMLVGCEDNLFESADAPTTGSQSIIVHTEIGTSWSRTYTSNNPGEFPEELYALTAMGPLAFVAVGAVPSDTVAGGIIKIHAGSGWTNVDLPPTLELADVASGLTGLNAVAVGNGGIIFSTRDQGETWNALSSPVSKPLSGIELRSDVFGLIVGTNTILRSTDDGGSWTVVASPDAGLRDVVILPPDHAYAVGYHTSGSTGAIARSSDGGLTWATIVYGTQPLNAVATDFNTVMAVGDNGTIIKSEDGGTTWTDLESNVTADLYAIKTFNQNWVAAGTNGTILRSRDGGSNWEALNSGTTEHTFYDLVLDYPTGSVGDGFSAFAIGWKLP